MATKNKKITKYGLIRIFGSESTQQTFAFALFANKNSLFQYNIHHPKTEANEDKDKDEDEDEDEDKDNPVQPSTAYHPHFIVTPSRPFQNT